MTARRAGQVALLALAVSGQIWATRLPAQACAAFPSLTTRHVRVAVSAASYSYGTHVDLSLTAGRRLYGSLQAGSTHDDGLDASQVDLGAEAGFEIATNAERLFVCPVAALTVSLGPYDFLLHGMNYRRVDAALGIEVGAVAARFRRAAILLAGGVRTNRLTVTYWPNAEKRASGSLGWSLSHGFVLFEVAAGFIVDQAVTIRPGVTIPVGFPAPRATDDWVVPLARENGELSVGIGVALSIGRLGASGSAARAPRREATSGTGSR